MIKREDVPEGIIEKMEELFPGMEIKCAGDIKELPEEVKKAVEAFELHRLTALRDGLCMDCGKPIPNFPKTEEEFNAWNPPADWSYYESGDDPMGFVCPECERNTGTTGDNQGTDLRSS